MAVATQEWSSQMIRRLVFLICGSALLAVASVIVCQLVFPDVVPSAIDENAQQAWRREAAFLVTTVAWLMAEVSAISTIGLVAFIWKGRRAKMR
jgi:hypothetical protein